MLGYDFYHGSDGTILYRGEETGYCRASKGIGGRKRFNSKPKICLSNKIGIGFLSVFYVFTRKIWRGGPVLPIMGSGQQTFARSFYVQSVTGLHESSVPQYQTRAEVLYDSYS